MTVLANAETSEREGGAARAERTCVGCRGAASRSALLRLAYVPAPVSGHALIPDLAGKLGGRGVWVHAQRECVRRAARGGAARALRQAVQVDPVALAAALRAQLERRMTGLLLAALRARRAAVGTDAVIEAMAACTPALLLVAKDAAGRRNELTARAMERGTSVVALFDKRTLGHLTGRGALGVVAILDRRIAREIEDSARWLAGLSEDG